MKLLKDKFGYAYQGIKLLIKDKSIIIQIVLAIIAILTSLLLQFNIYEIIIVLICITIVIVSECINTCIERICDLIDSNDNDKIRIIKDMASGFVYFASIMSLIIAIILFINNIG